MNIRNDKLENDTIYTESEYFKNSDVKIIQAIIYYKEVDANLKKTYDALRVVESKYKNDIEIKIKTVKVKQDSDFHVVFYHQDIYENCSKLDSYIYIIENIIKNKNQKSRR